MGKSGFVVPFIYTDLEKVPDWRSRLVWPIDTSALREQGALSIRKSIAFIEQVEDDLVRQVLIVGLGQITNRFQALSEAAMVACASAEQSLQIVGGPPELAALTHDVHLSKPISDAASVRSIQLIEPPRHAFLRQIARTHSYTPWYRMPSAMLALDGTALSHNSLLIQELRQQGKSARFVHAVGLLADIRKRLASVMLRLRNLIPLAI